MSTKERVALINIYQQIRKLSEKDKEYKPYADAIRKGLLRELGVRIGEENGKSYV